MTRAEESAPSHAPEALVPAASSAVRWSSAAAIGLNVLLTVTDLWRVAAFPLEHGHFRPALLVAALTIPLHLRHVAFGLRGERPPAGAWTLAALAVANLVGVYLVGIGWFFQVASLAVSIMLVVRGRWTAPLVAAVMLSPTLLSALPGKLPAETMVNPGFLTYLTFALAWRSVTQLVPVRLVAALRRLEAAQRELELRAVVREKIRIDGELRSGVGIALKRIIASAEAARSIAPRDPAGAAAELRQLVHDSRRALAHARQLVAGYRATTVRAELDAARLLLEASGATVRVVVDDGVALEAPSDRARPAIRAALVQALRDESGAAYLLDVDSDERGELRIALVREDGSRRAMEPTS